MTFGSEFWAAISGAVVAGVIALGIQLIALRAAKKERLAERKERKEAVGHSIMFKAMRIHSNLYNLHLHLEESFSAVDPGLHSEPFTFVLPLANAPDDVHFSPEEMSLIVSFNKPDLTDRLMSLDVIHNSLIDIFETYAALRNDIQSLMPAQMNGNVGESSFTHEEWLVVRPRMVTMNQVLTGARERAKVDYEDSRKAVRELLTELNEQLGLNLRLQFKAEKLAALAESIDE
jgi:hypothetical protein